MEDEMEKKFAGFKRLLDEIRPVSGYICAVREAVLQSLYDEIRLYCPLSEKQKMIFRYCAKTENDNYQIYVKQYIRALKNKTTPDIINQTFYKNYIWPHELRRRKPKKTSEEWNKKYRKKTRMIIYDPDGWDRVNYKYSWHEEMITWEEFLNKAMLSTQMPE